MKAIISIGQMKEADVSFIHQAIDNAVRDGVRICVTLTPEESDKPTFPGDRPRKPELKPNFTSRNLNGRD